MRVEDEFFNRGPFSVGNGENAHIWEDIWLGDLSKSIASLYNVKVILLKLR
jgi:hypothetical protein